MLPIPIDKVSEQWPAIKESIARSLSSIVKVTEESLATILEALLKDKLRAWVLYDKENMEKALALFTTAISVEPISKTKNLFIYSAASFGVMSEEAWEEAFKYTKAHAKAFGCHKIIAVTENARIIKVVEKLGGSVKTRQVELEVN